MGGYPFRSKGFWGSVIVIISAVYMILTGDYQQGIALLGIGLGLLGIRKAVE